MEAVCGFPGIKSTFIDEPYLNIHCIELIEEAFADMSTPKLFIHAKFEVPRPAVANGSGNGKNNVEMEGTTTTTTNDDDGESIPYMAIKNQYFDASNCKPALIGLSEGVDPVKVCL